MYNGENTPLVSVIIPVYNCEKYLSECVESVLAQIYPNLEILIIDDCSEDSSLQIAKAYAQKYGSISLIEEDKNYGVSHTRNIGIDKARGEFLLFLDADDAITSDYISQLMIEQQETGAVVLGYRLLRAKDSDFRKVFVEVSANAYVEFRAYSVEEAKRLFSKVGADWDTSAIGGKLILREAIGELRFETTMKYGEDTLFLHRLLFSSSLKTKGIVFVRGMQTKYIYRIHDQNAIKKKYVSNDLTYINRFYCEAEYYANEAKGDAAALYRREANYWLELAYFQLGSKYLQSDVIGKKAAQGKVKEMKNLSSFQCFSKSRQWHLILFSISPKLTLIIKKCTDAIKYRIHLLKNLFANRKKNVGILTFHCADNHGAMLQAYALRETMRFLRLSADILDYSPIYMTGRHWYIPYVPMPTLKGVLRSARVGLRTNIRVGYKNYHSQRKKMRNFREKFVRPVGIRKHSILGLKIKKYGAYVMGSDQIWNPDLTGRLRKAYFCPRKDTKLIAYAASFGGERIPPKYDVQFSEYGQKLSAVSMREKSAVPYVQERLENTGIAITSVCDPVFLMEPGKWYDVRYASKEIIEKGYIFVHLTEKNELIEAFIKRLATNTGKKIVRFTRVAGKNTTENIKYVTTAGPEDFLAYIHSADYVITNSFHGCAFAILFQKQMAIATHSNRGARLIDLLENVGLQDRMLREENVQTFAVDKEIDWKAVCEATAKMRQEGRDFLLTNLGELVQDAIVS